MHRLRGRSHPRSGTLHVTVLIKVVDYISERTRAVTPRSHQSLSFPKETRNLRIPFFRRALCRSVVGSCTTHLPTSCASWTLLLTAWSILRTQLLFSTLRSHRSVGRIQKGFIVDRRSHFLNIIVCQFRCGIGQGRVRDLRGLFFDLSGCGRW
jgi:hypothetical protein